MSMLNHSQWKKIYIPFKIFPHFSSPSSPFSCLLNEFHHLVLSSPWALFQLSLYKWEPIAYQTQGQLYIKILGSSIYGFRRLKAKPFKELQHKWLQIQISLSAVFYFSFFLFYCEFINPLRPTLKEIEGWNKTNLELSIKTKLNSTFNIQGRKILKSELYLACFPTPSDP